MRDPDGFTREQAQLADGLGWLVVGWHALPEARRRLVLRVLCESLADLEAPIPAWLVAMRRARLTNTN